MLSAASHHVATEDPNSTLRMVLDPDSEWPRKELEDRQFIGLLSATMAYMPSAAYHSAALKSSLEWCNGFPDEELITLVLAFRVVSHETMKYVLIGRFFRRTSSTTNQPEKPKTISVSRAPLGGAVHKDTRLSVGLSGF